MPTPYEIVEEVRAFKEPWEQRFSLPWFEDRTAGSVWRHKLVHLVAQLPDGLFEDVVGLMLDEPSFAIRGVALHIARMRGAKVFADKAAALLDDASVNVRALAAAAIGQFGDDAGVEALLETKDGENVEVKKAVVDAFKRLRDVRCIPLMARWAGRVGEDDRLRRAACETLGAIADDAAMPVLQRVLFDDVVADDIRGEAARAIGLIGGAEARGFLLQALGSDRPWVRAKAIEGLALLRDAGVMTTVLPYLAPTHPWMVRLAAIEAAARTGGAASLEHLAPLLEDREIQIRGMACVALGLVGNVAAQKKLKRALEDKERVVRAQALEALARASGRDFGFKVEQHVSALDAKALDAAIKAAMAWEPA
ncbi:MAG TPA: HEAT repeat domain-containing protein [Planctomycetota bacterium]|nr:HEAT repeat domain-containing protein [Planctomycetota bacterium]